MDINSPGVYLLFSRTGRLQYVGKVKRFRYRDRIDEHKRDGRIPFAQTRFIATFTQEAALRKEGHLIARFKPPYNKKGK